MKIETIPLEDHQIKLTVEFESDQFLQAKQKAARNLAKKLKIPGFRPGKAPYSVIARFVGDEAITEEGVELLVKDFYPKIIEEAKVKPYGPGKLENISSLDPLRIDFIVPLEAEIKLGDYRSIRIPYEPKSITDQEIEDYLQSLRRRFAIEETVERPAQENDHLIIILGAREFDADEINKVIIPERQLSVVIADKEGQRREEWPFEGFSRELIGVSAGDQKKVIHTFSDDSPYENLRGKTIEFSIQVEEVRFPQLPDLDDDFAKSIGDHENLDQLKADIRKSLEAQALEIYNEEYDDLIINQILSQSELKYPPQMIENEIDDVINELINRLYAQGLDLDTYLKTLGIDIDQLREEARPVAETRIRRSLILYKLSEEENIEVDNEELQNNTARAIDIISSSLSDNERRITYSEDFFRMTVANVYAEMKLKSTLNHLRNIARGLQDEELSDEKSDNISAGSGEMEISNRLAEEDSLESIQAPSLQQLNPDQDENSSHDPELDNNKSEV